MPPIAGPNGVGFHDVKGYPIVDTDKFPDMKVIAPSHTSRLHGHHDETNCTHTVRC
jgi:hypothetical protein